jgi:hypothetical protein
LRPFAERRAPEAGGRLGLLKDAAKLSSLVGDDDYPRLVAALVRVKLDDDHGAVRAAA